MFLNESKFARAIKTAYKNNGLRVHNEDGTFYIEGNTWMAKFADGGMPKEIMGEMIKLIGKIPACGESINYSQDGMQMEINMPIERIEMEDNFMYDILPITINGSTLIAAQNGTKHLISSSLLEVIDISKIEKEQDDGTLILESYSDSLDSNRMAWSDGEVTFMIDFSKNTEFVDRLLGDLKQINCNV